MTIDAAQIAQTIAQLGATGLLALGLYVVWRRLIAREDRMDLLADAHSQRLERVIGTLSGEKHEDTKGSGERRDRGAA